MAAFGVRGRLMHNVWYANDTALAVVLHRSLKLVQVDGDRQSPLPRAAKLGELVLARVALGQRA